MRQKKYIFAFVMSFFCVIAVALSAPIARADAPTTNVTSNPAGAQTTAEAPGIYNYIAPLGNYFTGTIDLRDDKALTNYVRTWFRFAIGIFGIFGVVRLVMVGFTIITTSESVDAQKKIKDELWAIISSLILVGGSWIFLNTLNPQLVNQSLIIPVSTGTAQMREICSSTDNTLCADQAPRDSSGAPVAVDAKGQPILASNVTKGLNTDGYYYLVQKKDTGEKMWYGPFVFQTSCVDQATMQKNDTNADVTIELAQGATNPNCMYYQTHTDALTKQTEEAGRLRLKNGNVGVNNGFCANSLARHCTDLTGLADEVFVNLIGLSGTCQNQMGKNCSIILTGGTEIGMHKTHGPSFNYTYDMNYNTVVDQFLKQNATLVAPSFSHTQPNIRYLFQGWWYNYESDGATNLTTGKHYHVCMDNPPGKSYASDKFWPCKDSYINPSTGKLSDLNDTVCKVNPNNQNQKLCLGVQIPN